MKKIAIVLVLISFIVPSFIYADVLFSGATDTIVEAVDENGAVVSFSPIADDEGESIPVSCDPASGTTFAVGTTTVTCTATATSTTQALFTVTVQDTTAPTLTTSTHKVIATSTFDSLPSSAYPTAEDAVDDDVAIAYTYEVVDADTVSVTWTATDGSGNTGTLIEEITVAAPVDIALPNGCSVTDTDSIEHVFPLEDSPSDYLAICLLAAAQEASVLQSMELADSDFGLGISSVNGIASGATEFWAIWVNDGFANCGIQCIALSEGDIVSLVLTDWMNNNAETVTGAVAFRVGSLTELPLEEEGENNGGGSGGDASPPPPEFSVPLALTFLAEQQNADGSFANTLITDWAAIAFSASDPGAAKTKLRTYLLTAPSAGSDITDHERRAMALMALGINPYTGTSVDYIAPIVAAFDGTQIGAVFPHDDIFAIFPLINAGYSTSDDIIKKAVAYIVLKQNTDGSWGDPDSTAAAVQALTLTLSEPGVAEALTKAKEYLHTQQRTDGGFSNSSSASWVLQAISAFGESPSTWVSNAKTPLDYLTSLQQTDGGVDLATAGADNRAWATTYAVPGVLGTTWNSLLSSFSKPAGAVQTEVQTATTTLPTATSTPLIATSTPPVATSTPLTATTTAQTATTTLTFTLPSEEPQPPAPAPKRVVKKTPPVATSTQPIQDTATTSEQDTNSQLAAAGTVSDGVVGKITGFFKKMFSFFGRLF